ncbi:hypothetical protein D3C86_2213130 [compost metagenome]
MLGTSNMADWTCAAEGDGVGFTVSFAAGVGLSTAKTTGPEANKAGSFPVAFA